MDKKFLINKILLEIDTKEGDLVFYNDTETISPSVKVEKIREIIREISTLKKEIEMIDFYYVENSKKNIKNEDGNGTN